MTKEDGEALRRDVETVAEKVWEYAMSEHKDPFAQTRAEHLRERFAEEARQEQVAEATYRRPLTPAECDEFNLPTGTEARTDLYGRLLTVPNHETMHMRLEILSMARAAPDGAAAPPIKDVIERARAYWRFVQTGE